MIVRIVPTTGINPIRTHVHFFPISWKRLTATAIDGSNIANEAIAETTEIPIALSIMQATKYTTM